MNIVKQSATLLAMTQNPLALIERCGRVCYKSEERINCGLCTPAAPCSTCLERQASFVRGLIKRGHESVLEHASATVLFVCDRGISHEIVRHRLASYSQESTRYCNYISQGITVIEPPELNELEHGAWVDTMRQCECMYDLLLSTHKPQIARAVLPTCLKTEIAMTANFREWRHVFKLRLIGTAGTPHPQVVELMAMAYKQFMEKAAPCFEDLCK